MRHCCRARPHKPFAAGAGYRFGASTRKSCKCDRTNLSRQRPLAAHKLVVSLQSRFQPVRTTTGEVVRTALVSVAVKILNCRGNDPSPLRHRAFVPLIERFPQVVLAGPSAPRTARSFDQDIKYDRNCISTRSAGVQVARFCAVEPNTQHQHQDALMFSRWKHGSGDAVISARGSCSCRQSHATEMPRRHRSEPPRNGPDPYTRRSVRNLNAA